MIVGIKARIDQTMTLQAGDGLRHLHEAQAMALESPQLQFGIESGHLLDHFHDPRLVPVTLQVAANPFADALVMADDFGSRMTLCIGSLSRSSTPRATSRKTSSFDSK